MQLPNPAKSCKILPICPEPLQMLQGLLYFCHILIRVAALVSVRGFSNGERIRLMSCRYSLSHDVMGWCFGIAPLKYLQGIPKRKKPSLRLRRKVVPKRETNPKLIQRATKFREELKPLPDSTTHPLILKQFTV